jgi:Asp/Glu/hydantoin racemase
LCAELLPGVETFNIADDSLIKEVIREGRLTPSVSRRVASQVISAAEAGADQIVVTCSSIGAAVEQAASLVNVPVLRVDRPMADLAIATGPRVGVAATLPTTLGPTVDLLQCRAKAAGASIELSPQLCEGAFEALMGGDAATHDDLVGAAIESLASRCDVVVLAQASMARVAAALRGVTTPVLTSPRLAISFLAEVGK